jgi:hypothetical protein
MKTRSFRHLKVMKTHSFRHLYVTLPCYNGIPCNLRLFTHASQAFFIDLAEIIRIIYSLSTTNPKNACIIQLFGGAPSSKKMATRERRKLMAVSTQQERKKVLCLIDML